MSSYFLIAAVNIGWTLKMIKARKVPKNKTATTNIIDSPGFIIKDINIATHIISGALTNPLINSWNEFWILLTSVVNLVISPAVENLSIFVNENDCILENKSFLKFLANPAEA